MYKIYGLNSRKVFSFATILFVAIFLSASLVGKAEAAINANVVTSLTSVNQTIKASSTPTAVIGLNLVSSSETFASTSIAFLVGALPLSPTPHLRALRFTATTQLPARRAHLTRLTTSCLSKAQCGEAERALRQRYRSLQMKLFL